MRIVAALALSMLLALPAAAQELASERDKRSYAIGMDIACKLKSQALELNDELIVEGFRDTLLGKETKLSQEDLVQVMDAYRQEFMQQRAKEQLAEAEANKARGKAFLEENKTKDGVKVTGSGLQYKVLKKGKGASPKADDTVTVHYRGTLIDGTEFDSSYRRGQPATFPVHGVIPGWVEALQMMKPGSKWMLYIPSELAYDSRQMGQYITPNSTLIFEVELLDIKNGE